MKKYLLLAIIFYIFCAFLVTYPVVSKINKATVDGAADTYLMLWTLSWDVHQLSEDPVNLFDANYFYPHDNTLALSEHHLGSALLALPIIKVTNNPVLAFNLLILLYLVLGALGAYLLAYHFTNNHYAALLAGVIFGFAPYRLGHLSQLHLLATIFPWAVLCLVLYLKNKRSRYLIIMAVLVLWQSITSWHLGLFTYGLIAIILLFYKLLYQDRVAWKQIIRVTTVLLGVAALLIPLYLPYLNKDLATLPEISVSTLLHYSPRIIDYLMVSPWLMYLFNTTVKYEQFIYFGISTSLILIIGFIYLIKNKDQFKKQAKLLAIFGSSAIAFGLLSLGPLIYFTKPENGVVGPFYILRKLFPLFDNFRVPARFYLVTLLCLAIIIAIIAAHWLKKKSNKKIIAVGALVFLMLLEYSFMPPITPKKIIEIPTNREDIPAVYNWLAEQEPGQVVLEVPVSGSTKEESKRMYYSTYYWHRIVTGYNGYYPAAYLMREKKLMKFPSAISMREIERLGVDYIIVHYREYSRDHSLLSREEVEKTDGLESVINFGDDYVYTFSP